MAHNHNADAPIVEETSPLLSPTSTSSWDTVSDPLSNNGNAAPATTPTTEQPSRPTSKPIPHLISLTLPLIGLQIAWSVELSNGSPYLLSLGISKALLALVWIAGPLSGTLVQPYVGMKSDRCRSRFGRRRVFMVGGAVATVVSLVVLAWAREIVEGVAGAVFGWEGQEGRRASEDAVGVRNVTIFVAVVMVYVLDFAINVVQAATRAFIVDGVPTHQQDVVNAWASRMSGIGIIIGYLFGYVDVPTYFWFFGRTQFQVLCVLASLMLGSTLAISCLNIRERDPRLDPLPPSKQQSGILTFFRDLYHAARSLPHQIKAVCIVQFFSWIGWFPFLFYITTYIGELYVQPIFSENPKMSQDDVDAVWEHATRVGTFALFMFAITTFIASVVLPFFIGGSFKRELENEEPSSTPLVESSPSTPRASAMEYFPMRGKSKTTKTRFSILSIKQMSPNLTNLTLRRAWLMSHIIFATLMWLTFLIRSPTAATILVAFVGIPWAMTNWAPFALIAEEISKREDLRRRRDDHGYGAPHVDDGGVNEQAGIVLGIHNVAIAAPQVIATLVSSAIFEALQKPRGSVGDESVAWVLRFGGLAALVAAWLTRKVEEK